MTRNEFLPPVLVQKLSLASVISILQQCSSGLHHLHSLGIIHRDFRAANILVAARDPLHVVVADFGVSHQLQVYAQVLETEQAAFLLAGCSS